MKTKLAPLGLEGFFCESAWGSGDRGVGMMMMMMMMVWNRHHPLMICVLNL